MNPSRENGQGVLYVVATPIGCLADITFRAVEVLKQADWIVCEDSRRTLKLLNHYGIQKPILTIFGPKEKKESSRILNLLAQSKSVALVTDAGTPGISDPGHLIVRQASESGFQVRPVPGPSALSSAVSVSGCCENGFVFLGFLHRRKSRMKKELSAAKTHEKAVVFFESPFRVYKTLELALEVFGKDCFCWVARELTKMFEEHFEGRLEEVLAQLKNKEILGEVTVILKPFKTSSRIGGGA